MLTIFGTHRHLRERLYEVEGHLEAESERLAKRITITAAIETAKAHAHLLPQSTPGAVK